MWSEQLRKDMKEGIKKTNRVKLNLPIVSVPLCRYTNCNGETHKGSELWCKYHDLQING